jgi:hypothetical protein
VERIHPAHPYCWRWKGYTLHIHTAGGGKDTPCTTILLAVERDTPCTSILLAVERDTPCMSILLAVERIHPAHPYCWRWKVIHPARQGTAADGVILAK